MIFDYHDVSNFVVLVQSSCGVGQDDRLDTHQLKDAHGHGDLTQKEHSMMWNIQNTIINTEALKYLMLLDKSFSAMEVFFLLQKQH